MGPKIQLGGLKLGLLSSAYHPDILPAVLKPLAVPSAKHSAQEMRAFAQKGIFEIADILILL